jgi:hypothetical protein
MEQTTEEQAVIDAYVSAALKDLEESADGIRAKVLMIGNSTIAAVGILFNRYGISQKEAVEAFDLLWASSLKKERPDLRVAIVTAAAACSAGFFVHSRMRYEWIPDALQYLV